MPLGAAVFCRLNGGRGCCGLGIWGYCGREAVEHFFNFRDFVLLSEPRGPDLEPGVEHFCNFYGFCSTFGTARTGFGACGRTFFKFLENLFYFRSRADRIWSLG